jgi:hypothetical protein
MVEAAFTRRRLESIVDDALRAAGVLGVLPTPLDAVRCVAGIHGVEPIDRLPEGLVRSEQPLLGALWFAEHTIYVEERQAGPRRRFTEAHELVHALCPWHEAVLRLDTEDELFRPVARAIEAEANFGASLLIFQGREFAVRNGTGPPTIERALAVAAGYGASGHATLHHVVETHTHPAAMLAVGRFPTRDGTLPVWRSVHSPAFLARFGSARGQLPTALRPGTALHELVEAARTAGRARTTIRVKDRAGRGRACIAESYYNRHVLLVLISDARAHAAQRAA